MEVDDGVKLRFAAELVRCKNASAAAMALFPNVGQALQVSYSLPTDPIVLAEIDRIKTDGEEADLMPTKCELALEVLAKARACVDNEDYTKLMKLYCDMMGHIEKPGTNVGVALTVAPVMVLRDHGTDEEWREKVAAQQRGLVLDANV